VDIHVNRIGHASCPSLGIFMVIYIMLAGWRSIALGPYTLR
jgi:hypothetical protein